MTRFISMSAARLDTDMSTFGVRMRKTLPGRAAAGEEPVPVTL